MDACNSCNLSIRIVCHNVWWTPLWIPACYDPQCLRNFVTSSDRIVYKKIIGISYFVVLYMASISTVVSPVYLGYVVATSPHGLKAGSVKIWLDALVPKQNSPHLLFPSLYKVGSRTVMMNFWYSIGPF